ncbi:MAG: nuclear transport factor 2 family protein [Chryseolinea sp.]
MMTNRSKFTGPAYAQSVVPRPKSLVLIGFLFATLAVQIPGFGQASDEQQIKDVIAQLFKGMELGDSAMAGKCFMPQVTVATVKTTREGQLVLTREGGIAGFLKAIGTPHPEKWYEETWNIRVTSDGALAQVWCDYAFYLGNKFSHCGVDAFQLFKDKGTWKIFHLADTRRSAGCDIPKDIVKKHTQ